MSQKDYYKILGVSENASEADIKKAYKKLAIKYHPDKHHNSDGRESAEARFKEVSEAYYVLGNAEKRKQYDMMRKYGYSAGGGPGMGGGAGGGSYGFNFEDLLRGFSGGRRSSAGGDYSMFSDIFGDIFGGGSQASNPFGGFQQSSAGSNQSYYGGGCGRKQQKKVKTDIEMDINLSKAQAKKGGKIKLKLPDGDVLMVKVPADARNGQKLKVRDKGKMCSCCDKRGDLLLVLNVK